ncbi:hypothetical protein [Actinomadura sp. WAC 06369]|uniref:hypothetical protein n=1 Tax=Actinomadura sp. WAC 06369 TaxID=2203193 RepID=UPI000F76BEE7|nr:hypothetical protein [Actinomadura sp. WAC 06369]
MPLKRLETRGSSASRRPAGPGSPSAATAAPAPRSSFCPAAAARWTTGGSSCRPSPPPTCASSPPSCGGTARPGRRTGRRTPDAARATAAQTSAAFAAAHGRRDGPWLRRRPAERLRDGADDRFPRYWTLIADINGEPAKPDPLPAGRWSLAALDVADVRPLSP